MSPASPCCLCWFCIICSGRAQHVARSAHVARAAAAQARRALFFLSCFFLFFFSCFFFLVGWQHAVQRALRSMILVLFAFFVLLFLLVGTPTHVARAAAAQREQALFFFPVFSCFFFFSFFFSYGLAARDSCVVCFFCSSGGTRKFTPTIANVIVSKKYIHRMGTGKIDFSRVWGHGNIISCPYHIFEPCLQRRLVVFAGSVSSAAAARST